MIVAHLPKNSDPISTTHYIILKKEKYEILPENQVDCNLISNYWPENLEMPGSPGCCSAPKILKFSETLGDKEKSLLESWNTSTKNENLDKSLKLDLNLDLNLNLDFLQKKSGLSPLESCLDELLVSTPLVSPEIKLENLEQQNNELEAQITSFPFWSCLQSTSKQRPSGPRIKHNRYKKDVETGLWQENCCVCKRPFERKHDLWRHERRHIGIKPFSCNLCVVPNYFTDSGNIRKHIRHKHKRQDQQGNDLEENFLPKQNDDYSKNHKLLELTEACFDGLHKLIEVTKNSPEQRIFCENESNDTFIEVLESRNCVPNFIYLGKTLGELKDITVEWELLSGACVGNRKGMKRPIGTGPSSREDIRNSREQIAIACEIFNSGENNSERTNFKAKKFSLTDDITKEITSVEILLQIINSPQSKLSKIARMVREGSEIKSSVSEINGDGGEKTIEEMLESLKERMK